MLFNCFVPLELTAKHFIMKKTFLPLLLALSIISCKNSESDNSDAEKTSETTEVASSEVSNSNPAGQQSRIRSDSGSVNLKPQPTVKKDPQSRLFRFTHWVSLLRGGAGRPTPLFYTRKRPSGCQKLSSIWEIRANLPHHALLTH